MPSIRTTTSSPSSTSRRTRSSSNSATAMVVVGGLVEGRGDHLSLRHAALPVGNLLRALVGQEHEELHLGVVGNYRLRGLLQDRGLSRFRR